ncbi:hypothetical protein D3C85_1040650 [compost metagenome]
MDRPGSSFDKGATSMVQTRPFQRTAVLAIGTSSGRRPRKTAPSRSSGVSSPSMLAITPRVAGSAISIGPHRLTPHARPPSASHSDRACSKAAMAGAASGSAAAAVPPVAEVSSKAAAQPNRLPMKRHAIDFPISHPASRPATNMAKL